MLHQFSLAYATAADKNDPLSSFREQFYIPYLNDKHAIYFLGNSLGLQPKTTQDEVLKIMEQWANFGVEGFFMGNNPWLQYHKKLLPPLSKIFGAKEHELVVMNHLTVNLHLLMISFYQPTAKRHKIICEAKAFPSDQYVMQSQIRMHGLNMADSLIEVHPRDGEETIRPDDIISAIHLHGESTALVLFSGVNYYTGQIFDMAAISAAARIVGANVGFDLAHAAGNIELRLHDWDIDFACWCNYKYLNSGPGAIAGAFIHEKHLSDSSLQRLEGWWGNDEKNRFKMEDRFTPSHSAEAWQMSTAPMMQLASHFASLKLIDTAGFHNMVVKSNALSSYLLFVLNTINDNGKYFSIITPQAETAHGCQVSISVHHDAKKVFDQLLPAGVFADWREPNV
ncbi:MAG: kynureninase, partial [Ferruginibacter sp.]